jgi:ABC-type nitrate/sulfonate/bicarbonate transport system permease component
VGPDGNSAFLHIALTLTRITIAFVASVVGGMRIGLAMGPSAALESALLIVIPLMMPAILMVFLAAMWFGFSEAGGSVDRHGSSHALCHGEYIRRHQGNGQVLDQGGGDLQVKQITTHSQGLPAAADALYFSVFRYAFGMTWKIVALAETFGLKYGIGYMFCFCFGQFNMTQVLPGSSFLSS